MLYLEQLRVRVSPYPAVTPLRCRPHCGAVPISPGSAVGSAAPRLLRGAPLSPPRVPTTPKLWGEPFPIPTPLCPRSTAVGIGFYGNSETNDGVYQLLYALDNANHTLTGIDALVGAVGQGPPTPFEPPRGAALPSRSSSPPFFLGKKRRWGTRNGAGGPAVGLGGCRDPSPALQLPEAERGRLTSAP